MSKIKHQIKKYRPHKKYKKSIIPPIPPAQSNSYKPNPDNPADKSTNKKKRFTQKDIRGWILVLATIAMAIFTYELFDVSTQQISDAKRAIHKTDSVTNIALQRTKTADSIAEQALKEGVKSNHRDSVMRLNDALARERNTKKELRAYVAIKRFHVFALGKGGIGWMIEEINTGKTPAYKMTGTGQAKPGGTGVYDKEINYINLVYPGAVATMQGSGLNDTMNFFIDSPRITTEEIDKIKNGYLTMYIYGYIEYFDVFGDKHRTRFCYKSIADFKSVHVFSKYERYNDDYTPP